MLYLRQFNPAAKGRKCLDVCTERADLRTVVTIGCSFLQLSLQREEMKLLTLYMNVALFVTFSQIFWQVERPAQFWKLLLVIFSQILFWQI